MTTGKGKGRFATGYCTYKSCIVGRNVLQPIPYGIGFSNSAYPHELDDDNLKNVKIPEGNSRIAFNVISAVPLKAFADLNTAQNSICELYNGLLKIWHCDCRAVHVDDRYYSETGCFSTDTVTNFICKACNSNLDLEAGEKRTYAYASYHRHPILDTDSAMTFNIVSKIQRGFEFDRDNEILWQEGKPLVAPKP